VRASSPSYYQGVNGTEGVLSKMEQPTLTQQTPAWLAFVQISFVLSLGLMIVGICLLPVDLWIRGYLGMGLFFTVSATITLSKTMRDEHEAKKIVNRIHEVKTEKMLQEFDLHR
jgi:hypothetical protein